jgi:hypothetical protein
MVHIPAAEPITLERLTVVIRSLSPSGSAYDGAGISNSQRPNANRSSTPAVDALCGVQFQCECGDRKASSAVPFKHRHARDHHFERHEVEVGARTADEYEKMAEAFMTGPLKEGVRECHRTRDGALARFDPATTEYGVLTTSGTINTFMLLIIPPTSSDTPTQYFERDCSKRDD